MAKGNSAGIQQIAEKLGISAATVSRALRQETLHLVKPDRRKQIIELADSMRFRPNPGARFIRKGFNPIIGVVVPHAEDLLAHELYGQFLGGILQTVNESDWEIKITMLSHKSNISFIDKLRSIGMDCSGVIYCGKPLQMAELEELQKYRRPLVMLKSSLPAQVPLSSANCHVIGMDNQDAAATALRFLMQLGHKRIGLVAGPQSSRDFQERYASCKQQFAECHLELPEELIHIGSHDHLSGRDAGKKFLSLSKPPTAILCSADSLAFGVLDYAKEQHIKCPERLSIMGFDDSPWATCSTPQLTTMKQPLKEMAEKAVAFLQRDASSPDGDHYQDSTELKASLVIRESTGPAIE